MLLHLKNVLNAEELRLARQQLDAAAWVDGRVTAGVQSAQHKNNQQLPAHSPQAAALQQLVLAALDRHALFFSAALPKKLIPPLFNRYAGTTNGFGDHVDNAIRYAFDGTASTGKGGAGLRVRTDLSCTLFLSEPESYDGGELVVHEPFGNPRVKLPAGDALLYPGTSVHRVEPVTRGQRLACFFWIESMVRSDEQRRLLFDFDQHLMHLRAELGETRGEMIGLTGTYHNLLRQWADS
jgi:PKHD-type hydroxylase